jgi:hypothetical protein
MRLGVYGSFDSMRLQRSVWLSSQESKFSIDNHCNVLSCGKLVVSGKVGVLQAVDFLA